MLSYKGSHNLTETAPLSEADVDALNAGQHAAPFKVLGPHKVGAIQWVTTLQPGAVLVTAIVGKKETPLARLAGDVFSAAVAGDRYKLKIQYGDGSEVEALDPYAFTPVLTDFDQYLLGEGTHRELWRALGAHVCKHEKATGTHFAVWGSQCRAGFRRGGL